MTDTAPPTDQPGRCPRCQCEGCGGRLDQHTVAGCTCGDCNLDPQYACSLAEFMPPGRIGILAQQLGPLLSAHLGPKRQQRCLAVAHTAHHALLDYDHPEATR